MNLLPKEHGDFVKPEYWEKFFKKRGEKAFEWYGEYPDLCGVLHKYIKPADKVLMVGCGNSQLSADLYDVGYHNIVNIDISDTVISQMTNKHREQRGDMKFVKMDVTKMTFEDSEYTVVLDKGTLDALMVDNSERVVADVEKMFDEIERVLKLMGRYICISLLQSHILLKIVPYFSQKGWAVRIHKVTTEKEDADFCMPVFALVFTKFKKNPNLPQILEVCMHEEKNERLSSIDELTGVVKEMQYYAIVRQRITKRKVTEEQLSLSLYSEVAATPRYVLTIVDSDTKSANKFAIFIVPQGRETEWMFSTDKGRIQLAGSAGFERLVVVSLDRNHTYKNLDAIQSELSGKVMELAPPGFKPGTKVPFLSMGNDIGHRKILKQGTSPMSGEYVVEEVQVDSGSFYRRLVFLSNQNIIQSEARMKQVPVKKGSKNKGVNKFTVDRLYLACQHHVAMVAGLSCVQTDDLRQLLERDMSVLLVGLGGGGLPTFIHQVFPQILLDVVDIDPEMVSIATDWFGFSPDNKLQAHVDDGLKYVQQQVDAGVCRHVIMLDVDSKDVTVGLSCPPQPFVDTAFLTTVKQALHTGGVLVLNLVCRDETLKVEILQRVKQVFGTVFLHNIEDEVNTVVYAIKDMCLNGEQETNRKEKLTQTDKTEPKDADGKNEQKSTGKENKVTQSDKNEPKDADSKNEQKSTSKENKVTQSDKNESKGAESDKSVGIMNKFTEHCSLLNKYLSKYKCNKEEVDLVSAMESLSVV